MAQPITGISSMATRRVLGDLVKVRNSDSGVTVSGVVQADGSVRVSGG